MPLVPLALYLLFGWAAAGWRMLALRLPQLRPRPALVPILVVLAALLAGGPFRGQSEEEPQHRSAVELLRTHAAPGTSLLAAQANALLLFAEVDGSRAINPTALDFEAEQGRLELAAIVDRLDPDLLLDTRVLRRQPGAYTQLRAVLRSGDWRLVEKRGEVALYARDR